MGRNLPQTDEAIDWFIRLQDQPNNASLRAAFDKWHSADPRHAQAYTQLSYMMALPALRQASREDAARLRATAPAQRRGWTAYAAAVAALLFIAIALWNYPAILLRWQADHLTLAGERATVILPDGSTMSLNTASAVALDFAEGRRKVTLLAGEAFFDVRPDPAHPFTVKGHFSEVVVTGTAFSVRQGDTADIVTLARGHVDVSRLAAPGDHVALAPGQRITASATAFSPVETIAPEEALAWLDGRVIFHDVPFAEALAELDRYYGGTVLLAHARLGDLRVSGSYRIDEPEAAIRALAETARASLTSLPGGLIILY